jgi:hypothetical protein
MGKRDFVEIVKKASAPAGAYNPQARGWFAGQHLPLTQLL